MADDRLSPLGAALRRADPDRFLTALFAPAGPRREALFALYAFNHELARAREVASEPTLGLIRLHWWREAVEEAVAGAAPRRHEVAGPLAEAIRAHALPPGLFEQVLAARERDMDEAGPPDLAALLAYAEGAGGALGRLAAAILAGASESAGAGAGAGGDAGAVGDAAFAAGTAFTLAGLLRAVPFHAAQRRLYLPADAMAAAGIAPERLFDRGPSPALAGPVRAIAAAAAARLAEAREKAGAVPKAARAAILPAALARSALRLLARAGHDPFDARVQAGGGAGRTLRLIWANATGRV